MSECLDCKNLRDHLQALNAKITEQRKTIKRLSRLEGSITKPQADRLRDKASRMEQRLKSAVARAEARVKLAYAATAAQEQEAESLRMLVTRKDIETRELATKIEQRDKTIELLRRQGARGPRELEKRDYLLLKRVQKHLTNPKTGKPYKGGEALCKEIARALVRP